MTIGDELLIGQVVNSNAAFIADVCTQVGVDVRTHVVVRDLQDAIVSELERLAGMVDVVITTGGLGPTHDDITVPSVAAFAGVELVEDLKWRSHLEQWMAARNRVLTPRNAAQAMVPMGAAVFHDSLGTAPGFLLTVQRDARQVTLCVLPGVPFEMQHLMKSAVRSYLQQRVADEGGEVTQYRTLHTTGIAESALADLIGEPSTFLGTSSLAFLPSTKGVRLRFGARHRDAEVRRAELDRVEGIVRARAGRYIIGHAGVSLSEAVGQKLLQHGHTLSVAESCTGGLLGGSITDVSGSSAWFEGGLITYSNAAKVRDLGVEPSTLDAVGAVSREVAEQMALGVRKRFGTTWGIGITGVAGPTGGSEEKPVGTVWIGVSGPEGTEAKQFLFGSDRASNRERSVAAALTMLWSKL